jgi:Fe-S oxidoreductase
MKPFNGIETNGNPWNLAASDRASWADGLGIPLMAEKPDAKVLYWVGCAASYDDRAKKIARATAKLMKQAGVDFAILGTEESCTGDPARRAGNEYLFQTMAQQNVETLKQYEAEKKTIVTTCPHCFNTLANEYPDFGGQYDVVHHTSFLSNLIDAKRLVPRNRVEKTVAFHDSCYLGRYNDVYDAPRKVLEAIPGVQLREVNYWNKNKGLCCGAGGAQMFMEEHEGQRVNVKRTLQLLETGAQTIASGCPFCMTMLTDGLKAHEKEESVQQKDVAELLAESVVLDGAAPAEAAE